MRVRAKPNTRVPVPQWRGLQGATPGRAATRTQRTGLGVLRVGVGAGWVGGRVWLGDWALVYMYALFSMLGRCPTREFGLVV